jgi:hypothetical protein
MRSPATITGALLLAAVGASIASCTKSQPADEAAPAVQPNVSSWREVEIYNEHRRPPECEYEVLGTFWPRPSFPDSAWEGLKRRVFQLGGDAAIDATSSRICDWHGCRYEMRAVAIRFTDPECTH